MKLPDLFSWAAILWVSTGLLFGLLYLFGGVEVEWGDE